jgi:hypothetical protein
LRGDGPRAEKPLDRRIGIGNGEIGTGDALQRGGCVGEPLNFRGTLVASI